MLVELEADRSDSRATTVFCCSHFANPGRYGAGGESGVSLHVVDCGMVGFRGRTDPGDIVASDHSVSTDRGTPDRPDYGILCTSTGLSVHRWIHYCRIY